jgi:membrane fusion protein, multidrug efflux system
MTIRNRRHATFFAATLWLALSVTGCSGPSTTAAEEEAVVAPPPVNVTVAELEATSMAERISLSGRVEPWVEVRIAAELGGRVDEVGFQQGQRVASGQVLARVGADLHQAALAEAEAALTGAQATWDKTRQLFERQAVPRQDLITATSQYEVARAQVEQAKLRLDRSIVRAPIAGVAVTRDIEPGEILAPGTPITTLQRLDRVKATVGIPENDVALFRAGSAATVTVDAWPDRTFEGRMHFLAPAATGPTRTFPAEIALDNGDGALRPGMVARVTLVRRQHDSAIVVPREALQVRDQGNVAIVLEGDVARVRPVRLGAFEGDRVLVEEGLAPGDRLVVNGHRGLVDGQRVQVVEQRP